MNRQLIDAKGFSLIELTVVLLIITLLASVAIRETSELTFQTRYEQTKERLERVKQAILGNPKQIINGQQAINGFVADMGRLPDQMRELFQPGVCHDATSTLKPSIKRPADCVGTDNWVYLNVPCSDNASSTKTACDLVPGAVWVGKELDVQSGLTLGWQGPYLATSSNPADNDAFSDGWGRLAQGYCSNPIYTNSTDCTTGLGAWVDVSKDFNYGWYFNELSTGSLTILSYGKEQTFGGTPPSYDADYPAPASQPAVRDSDWAIDISAGINANFVKQLDANGYCGFLNADLALYDTQQKCENAGGSWSGGACTAIDETSCKTVGGKWQSCFFSPAVCTAAGGLSKTDCQFTQKACDIAGASASYADQTTCEGAGAYWDTAASKCHAWDGNSTNPTYHSCLTNVKQALCVNAGGTWNSSTTHCDFSQASCALAGGAWSQDCTFADQAACEAVAGAGAWHNTIKPDSCVFTQAICTSLNGVSNGSDCYMSHAESVGTRYAANSCQAAVGNWTGQICMNVFYRDAATMTVVTASSAPVYVDENGALATQVFGGFNIGGVPIVFLPAGQNAIGIYEWDGDCDPYDPANPTTTNPFYPADRQNPTPVDFRAHTTLPVINW